MTTESLCGVRASDLVVFERNSDIVVGVSVDGTVLYANPRVTQVLDQERSAIEGRKIFEFIHPDDLAIGARAFQGMVDGEIGVNFTPAIYRIKRPDGTYVPIEFMGSPLLEDGPFAGWMILMGRYPGDQLLDNQLRSMLTRGAPISEVMALVTQFGSWRYADQLYAVGYTTEYGDLAWAGSALAGRLATEHSGVDTPWGRAAATGEPVKCELDELPPSLQEAARAKGLQACMAVPVTDPLHPGVAIIVDWSTDGGSKIEPLRYSMDQMVRVLAFVMQWQFHVAHLEQAARCDALTGLTNRASFIARLKSPVMSTSGGLTGILYVDLDHFKVVNDRYGHGTGDEVLVEAARRMSAAVRESDLLARLGGDEFAVLCLGIAGIDEAIVVAERLLAVLSKPIDVDGLCVTVSASIGIAVTAGSGDLDSDGLAFDALLDQADQAMYTAKASGRNRWWSAAV